MANKDLILNISFNWLCILFRCHAKGSFITQMSSRWVLYLVFGGAALVLGSVLAGALALLAAGAVVTALGGGALAVWGLSREVSNRTCLTSMITSTLTCSTSLATHCVFKYFIVEYIKINLIHLAVS